MVLHCVCLWDRRIPGKPLLWLPDYKIQEVSAPCDSSVVRRHREIPRWTNKSLLSGWSSPVEDNRFGLQAHPLFSSSPLSCFSALPRELCSVSHHHITGSVPLRAVAQDHILFKVPSHSHKDFPNFTNSSKGVCLVLQHITCSYSNTWKISLCDKESDFHLNNTLILGWWHYIKYSDLL